MADEQTPPKRDVNELFTLDASGPTSDPDGPLAHLMSMSPVADLGRPLGEPDDDDSTLEDPFPSSDAHGDLPGISDVSGLEDLYRNTTELPIEPGRADPGPVRPRPAEPVPPGRDMGAGSDQFRSFEVDGNLRFSTVVGNRPADGRTAARQDQPYPAALVPNAVPAPVAPGKSVRVPGQERRRSALPTVLAEITERRWFWASAAGVLGLAVLVVLAVGNIVPNPLTTDRIDAVAEDRVPVVPAAGGSSETSEADTWSSTGAGSGGLEPPDSTTSAESTTSSTATASVRRLTTVRATVRSTTTSISTTTSASTSTSVSSTATTASTSTTDTTAASSSTTGSSGTTTSSTTTDTTTDTTGNTSTTDDDSTTTDTSTGGSTTGGSGSSGEQVGP